MTWWQSMAGAQVRLSAAVQKRIGVSGFGVDDVGVIRHPSAIASVVSLGEHLGAVSASETDEFVALEHGSRAQVMRAEALGSKVMTALERHLESRIDQRLGELPGTRGPLFKEYAEWAKNVGWEFPAGCLSTDYELCFCLTEEPALAVFECGVGGIDGAIGDALISLAEVLSVEALKMPAHEALQYTLGMGFDVGDLIRKPGFETLRGASGEAVLDWLKTADEGFYEELGYWESDEETRAARATEVRDLCFANFDIQRRMERLVGAPQGNGEQAFAHRLDRIAAVGNATGGSLGEFAAGAAELLRGKTRAALIDELDTDERFERLPGSVALVDFGVPIDGLADGYQYLHEMAMNGDESAILPLESKPGAVVRLLERITLAERLMIALGVVIEESAGLSERRAA